MPFIVPIDDAKKLFPDYKFIKALTASEQKAAFHVTSQDGQALCLKIISPDYELQRLSREIKALQTLNHPNVVTLQEYTYSSTASGQRHYMVEEFIDGCDLAEKLEVGKPWELAVLLPMFRRLLSGLGALEQTRVVHRDLKPSNIRLRLDGTPVIIDFGLARHLDLPDITRTMDGAAIGTPKYFAPEQFLGTKYEIDHRTDLFAVGVLLYEVAAGEHPFWVDGISLLDLHERVCKSDAWLQQPQFISLPNALKILIKKLLEKDRVRRPTSALHVIKVLEKLEGAQ